MHHRVEEGHVVADRYRLDSRLGVGGMGEVWLAHDAVLGRSVALKRVFMPAPDCAPAVLREACAGAGISHPGVVTIHDALVDRDGIAWLSMEALTGETLAVSLGRRKRLSMDEVVNLGLQLLSALRAIHAAGLVHRDVKPGNIYICQRRRVVLTDFGLAAPAGTKGGQYLDAIEGSPPYLAPEAMLQRRFGPPSDLYALGVTLYRAVEGRHPADGHRRTGDGGPIPPSLPFAHAGRVANVIRGLTEPDPDARLDLEEAKSQLEAMTFLAAMPWAG